MKRLATVVLALCMVAGAAAFSGPANAIDVQLSGVWDTSFRFDDNLWFSKDDERDHFSARSRFRPQIEFIASENLRGVIQFQIGSIKWGEAASGGQLDTNTATVLTRRAYIDWSVTGTSLNFKIGLQHIGLPSAVRGNPFFGGNVAGVTSTVGFTDEVSLTGFWARPFVSDGNGHYKNNQSDMFGLVLDLNFDRFSFSPWLVYASVGALSGQLEYGYNYTRGTQLPAGYFANVYGFNDKIDVFAGGVALKVTPADRLSIGFDAAFSTADNGGRKNGIDAPEGNGYFVALTADYTLDWGTPGVFAWYSSGDSVNDRKNEKWGRMMALGLDDGVAFTRMGFTGSYGHGLDTVVSATGAGTWGLGLQIADLSFVEKLSHTVRAAYYQGTNAGMSSYEISQLEPNRGRGIAVVATGNFGEVLYMVEKDKAFEVNFDSQYQITDNFTAVLELGWIHMDLDNSGLEHWNRPDVDENAYNAQVILRYAF